MKTVKLFGRQSATVVWVLFVVGLPALAARSALAQPKIRLGEETFTFGLTPEALPVSHRYWLYSVGSDSLVIHRVQPSCGCTTVPLPKKRLAPGDSVPLDLTFDPKRFSGHVQKSVTITSNDTSRSEARISFVAVVGKDSGDVSILPGMVYMDTLGKDSQLVVLQNKSDSSYRLSVLSPPPSFLTIVPDAIEIPPKGRAALVIREGKDTPLGQYNGSVTFRCDGPQPVVFTLPIMGVGYAR